MVDILHLEHPQEAIELLGSLNLYAQIIDLAFSVSTEISGDGIAISGELEACGKARQVYEKLLLCRKQGTALSEQLVRYFVTGSDENDDHHHFMPDLICVSARGKPIQSKTAGQKRYVDALTRNELTFSIGPAGTGKTFLAVAMAVKAFRAQEVSRIILTRPAVEAGEKLGFLPGDLASKVDPYMRPLNDALFELMGSEQYLRNLERGSIEISPLAYMRGRTLDDAFIILDEAQNTTREQMKMFLTRIGFGSKTVVTGDVTQIDLPRDQQSGLIEIRKILNGVEGVGFVELGTKDVVRNALVQRIITAYDAYRSPINEKSKR